MRSPTSRWGTPFWKTTVTMTRLREEKQKEGKALSLTDSRVREEIIVSSVYSKCSCQSTLVPILSLHAATAIATTTIATTAYLPALPRVLLLKLLAMLPTLPSAATVSGLFAAVLAAWPAVW